MKLKHQLFLLTLLSLLFPIAGWLGLKSVDNEFRLSVEKASKDTLISLKASVQQILKAEDQNRLKGFVVNEVDEWLLDGDAAEWQHVIAYNYDNANEQLSVKIGEADGRLALFIDSNDATQNNQSLHVTENDHIILAVADERGVYQYRFKRQAEGLIFPDADHKHKPDFKAYWHEKADGYTLEVIFGKHQFHHLGFVSVNKHENVQTITGTLQKDQSAIIKLEPLMIVDAGFKAIIEGITPVNNHFSISDQQNRLMYESNKLPQEQKNSSWQWLITPIYQWLFAVDLNQGQWFYRQDGMVGVHHQVNEQGVSYQLKSMLPQGQQNMIQTLLKTGVLMISVVLILIVAYLLYATLLAWRIKRLNHALYTVLDDSGKFHIEMPSRHAVDEIGQLSRGIESMLSDMTTYTQYLKDLGSRLSHEMKTPLAIVQSSLDNLVYDNDPQFLHRAQEGTKRLRFILNQLGELSQLKYALEKTPKVSFDVDMLVRDLAEAYHGLMPNLKYRGVNQVVMIRGSQELLAQLIDKLMDNARSYVSEKGYIELSLELNAKKTHACLQVFNTDSQLPDANERNIFDSLVSVRNKQSSQQVHLGLGLYLVQLISRYHDAEVGAHNSSDPEGVLFSVTFNLIDSKNH